MEPSQESSENRSTWFGNRPVDKDMKTALVGEVFRSVAGKYDLMNDLMSLGIHRLWKAAMIDWLNPRPSWNVLDVGGGTGDIARGILEKAPGANVTICDLTFEMLAMGRDRTIDRGKISGMSWVSGNAESLPFPDLHFDAYTIAFCLRNVADPHRALQEAFRVLRPGGRFLCLEFSTLTIPSLARLYDLYSFKILPWLGERVAGDRASYQYLVESIRRFPDQKTLAGMMSENGFQQIEWRDLTGGIAALHSGWRI